LLDETFEHNYRYGYAGSSTAKILKEAGVPKGSMYHHFSSKKEMVMAMIKERLIPKVEDFFDFRMQKGASAGEIITHTINKIAKNRMLLAHGCPLHRLMFEMGSLDQDIAALCQKEFETLTKNLAKVIAYGIKRGEFVEEDPLKLAAFIITATWGLLSRLPQDSSSEQFVQESLLLLRAIRRQ
jgi:TetR/AcrR family transcriptional repressor of nem operon